MANLTKADLLQERIEVEFNEKDELKALADSLLKEILIHKQYLNNPMFTLAELEDVVKKSIYLGHHYQPEKCSVCGDRLNQWIGGHTCVRITSSEIVDNNAEPLRQRKIKFPIRFSCTNCYEKIHADRITEIYAPEIKRNTIASVLELMDAWWDGISSYNGSLKHEPSRKIVSGSSIRGLKSQIDRII
jgi:hypothetical protein